jgi:hypothetical protein
MQVARRRAVLCIIGEAVVAGRRKIIQLLPPANVCLETYARASMVLCRDPLSQCVSCK